LLLLCWPLLLLCWPLLLLCWPLLLLCWPLLLPLWPDLLLMLTLSPFVPCEDGGRGAENKDQGCRENRKFHRFHLKIRTKLQQLSRHPRGASSFMDLHCGKLAIDSLVQSK
jgi:hypothetical protein